MPSGEVASSGRRLRLFVAAGVPRDLLERIEEMTAGLRRRLPKARWAPPTNQHLTLKFLGATPPDKLVSVRRVVAAVADRHEISNVRLNGVGAFPSPRRARVLWMGIDDPNGLLAALAADLAEEFASLGYEAEGRPFTAHLTLARFKQPERVDEELSVPGDLEPFGVTTISLYHSNLSPRGARYELLDNFPLEL